MTKPAGWNNIHFLASLLVPPGSDVLDLGCGTGAVGAGLLRAGCAVKGVEGNEEIADIARSSGLDVLVADLEQEDGLDPLTKGEFDVVLCLDVLDHLREPGPALRRMSQFVRPTGVMIVSISNMTHAAVRLALLEGRVEQTEGGLPDRTRIGWYDRKVVEQVFATAGVEVLERLSVRRRLDETEIPVDIKRVPDHVRDLVEREPDAAVYQFVYVACLDRARVRWPQPHPAVAIIEESQRAAEIVHSSTVRAQSLESQVREAAVETKRLLDELSSTEMALVDRQRMSADVEEELHVRMAELDEARREITYFENELRFRDLNLVELRRQVGEQDLHLVELRRQVAALQAAYTEAIACADDAAQLRALCAELSAESRRWEIEGAELHRLQALETGLVRLRASAGYRLADAVSASLRRHRLVYGAARLVVRSLAGRRSKA